MAGTVYSTPIRACVISCHRLLFLGYMMNHIKRNALSGYATRRHGLFTQRGAVQTLSLKIFRGSIAGDRYAERKATHSFSNMLGQNARERLEEFQIDCSLHPGVAPKNLFKHIALSLPRGQKHPAAEWRQAVDLLMENIGAKGCNYTAHLHEDTDNQHIHVIYSRSRPDGKLVNQSWDYLRHREAAARVADELFGGRETPRAVDTPPAPPSDRAEAARRRALRRGTPPAHIDPEVVRAMLDDVCSLNELVEALHARRIEARLDRHMDGSLRSLMLRSAGAQEWLGSRSISPALSVPRLLDRLSVNSALGRDRELSSPAQDPWRAEQDEEGFDKQWRSDTFSRPRGA